jgi:DNA invertase Pin-like site-specific DNA recombinase
LERKKAKTVKKPKQITYWAFCVDILGPRCNSKSEDRRIPKLLGKSVLREMEELARRAVQQKLPHGFKAKIS